MKKQELQKLRQEAVETTRMELIRDAIRARKFSGAETLDQGICLINFALGINKANIKQKNAGS
jgi:hypothetical protein